MLVDKLKLKFKELKEEGRSEDSILIALKEVIQHYILNFIYTSRDYSHLTMYGGTVLRIGYGLPRMSEDIDFQSHKKLDLEKLKEDLSKHFKDNYASDVEMKIKSSEASNTDTIFVRIDFEDAFKFTELQINNKLQIRVDINYFPEANIFVKDTIPGGRGTELSYTIKTYPLSTLMASKAVAFLKRDARGIGDLDTNVKPRDVYDMMWYMNRGTMPDLEYLKVKGVNFETFLDFRDGVKLRANRIEDNAFRADLAQFFYDANDLENWLDNWRPKFMQLLDSYRVYEIGELESIFGHIDFSTENRTISYRFSDLGQIDRKVVFKVTLSDYWFVFSDKKVNPGNRVPEIEDKAEKGRGVLTELDYEYIGLFYNKITNYISRNKGIVFQDEFQTKLIRATADNLDPKKQIYLDKRLLQKIDFEELL